MSDKTKIDYVSLEPGLKEEASLALEQLIGSGMITVSFSQDLAHFVGRLLQLASENGAIAFGPVHADVTAEQASKILDIDHVLLERRVRAGKLSGRNVYDQTMFDLSEVLDLKSIEDARNELMLEASQIMENIDPTRSV